MASRAENQPLPLNPDGSPDLHRVTIDNIARFGIPEEQAKDLALMQESHPATPMLETKMSRRAVLATVPLGIGLMAGMLGKEIAIKTLNNAAESLAYDGGHSAKDALATNPTPDLQATPENPNVVEFYANGETPIPYATEDWNFILRRDHVQEFKNIYPDDKGMKITFTHRRIDEDGYITGTIKQLASTVSVSPEGEIELGTNVKESKVSTTDGEIVDAYTFPSFDARPFQTFMTITRVTPTQPVEEIYPVNLKTGEEYIRSRKKLPYVVAEKEENYSVSLASLAAEGERLNKLSQNTSIYTVAILDQKSEHIGGTPNITSDTKNVKIVFIPGRVAQMRWNGIDIEHPAQVRLSYEALPDIISKGPVGDEILPGHITFSNTMKSLDKFLKEYKLDQFGMGWNTPYGELMDIKSNDIYEYSYSIFGSVPEVKDEFFSEALTFLRNILPTLRHRPDTFEDVYDSLEAEQKLIVDEALFLTMRVVECTPASRYSYTAEEVFPHFQEISAKRTKSMQEFTEKYANDMPDEMLFYEA